MNGEENFYGGLTFLVSRGDLDARGRNVFCAFEICYYLSLSTSMKSIIENLLIVISRSML